MFAYNLRILQHFNSTPDDYAVVFTSGCTDALKLVADNFNFRNSVHSNYCKPKKGSRDENPKEKSDLNALWKIYDGCHGSFCYLDDNHTSVVGMREVAKERGASVFCVSKEFFTSDQTHLKCCHGNNLCAFPAQSNFSGKRYPLTWINVIKNVRYPTQRDLSLRDKEDQKHYLTLSNKSNHVKYDKTCCYENNYVLLDAAGYVCTSQLNLQKYQPDFIPISFYKIFGFPTGLGKSRYFYTACYTIQGFS